MIRGPIQRLIMDRDVNPAKNLQPIIGLAFASCFATECGGSELRIYSRCESECAAGGNPRVEPQAAGAHIRATAPGQMNTFSLFSPAVAEWFARSFRAPTAAQARAWP